MTLWRMEVWAGPTNRHYAEGRIIYNPSHLLDYPQAHDNTEAQNSTQQLPVEESGFSGFPEKSETHLHRVVL